MPCAIETTKRFRSAIKGHEAEVAQALTKIQEAFGHPHQHGGLGIRKLAPDLFECRAGLKLRLVFMAQRGALTFDCAGNHEDVQNYLRGK
jgi:hypothetical protein